jgi:hypothetical protein
MPVIIEPIRLHTPEPDPSVPPPTKEPPGPHPEPERDPPTPPMPPIGDPPYPPDIPQACRRQRQQPCTVRVTSWTQLLPRETAVSILDF